ncbi:histone-lysine N-methyltransferase ATX2 isoform X1 [Daucus carota subsp. sativus]|uniref:histone-lysine N-methyltransferase ATX2 isoform X1 n=1 Tax=Daucus carota subsp. sativus TaxID=79200 RepID=UPI0030836F69
MSNVKDIHGMARDSVKYIPLHEEYMATAPLVNSNGASKKRKIPERNIDKKDVGDVISKQWSWLTIDGEPDRFIGLECKVYWPLDDDWYCGRILGYNLSTERYHVKYNDGVEEHLCLSFERILFYVSPEEIQQRKLCCVQHPDVDSHDIDNMVSLAASLNHCSRVDPIPGDMIWAKVTGHPMWPAIVLDESACSNLKILNKISGERSVLVQFFGTHDFARLSKKQVTSFIKGLLSELHRKSKTSDFLRSLIEAKTYLSTEKLPSRMLSLQSSNAANFESASGEEDCTRDEEIPKNVIFRSCPFDIGGLQIISLGKIVKDSELLYDRKYICPEGYTAVRKLPSISDPKKCISYTMEVLRDGNTLNKPLFRVTSEKGEQFEGPTSSSCWDKLYRKIRKLHGHDALKAFGEDNKIVRSGPAMFGFSHPKIKELIRLSSTCGSPLDSSKLTSRRCRDPAIGYRRIHITWKDLDKCNVCYTDEEYDISPFLQCDNCRMMVHTSCYGELEPADGTLWYCNLCRVGAPESPPPCCLCPLAGGAMKPTTDGRWAHLACAISIPETCLLDVRKMEPIDGLNRINKIRWKLLCSICGVSHGACIQCSNSSCYVAYHPLCARAAGYFLEFYEEDGLRLCSEKEDEKDQCIRLRSYCKRHRRPSDKCIVVQESMGTCQRPDYIPSPNPSGCARTEPYNYLGRIGRKQPQSHEPASLKHLYLENVPYLVGGIRQHEFLSKVVSSQCNISSNISSMVEKYSHMKETFRRRLTFGKSGIHGYGIFAKQPHRAGDMVIEYTGEVVRVNVADRREHLTYDSLVGAGTCMFKIDDDRVIDATKAGNIARLINHSCEPNCYSRIITVNGDQHVIIYAKRDLNQWEELTINYRFSSVDEQLACSCGVSRCRGIVNDIKAVEQVAKPCIPQ